MAIEFEKQPFRWDNTGKEPSEELKTNGFQAGTKPSAGTFNFVMKNTNECLSELQTNLSELDGNVIKEIKGNGKTISKTSAGAVNITPNNIGAAASTHYHSASQINSGTLPIERGGTGGTTQVEALTNLGVVDTSTTGFNTSNVDDFVAQVKTYVENNLQVGVPLFFGANNSARGSYGAAFAWSMSADSKTIFLYNGSTGIRVYNWNTSNGWQKGSLG